MPLENFIGNAAVFPVLSRHSFLDHAATAPLCTVAAQAQVDFIQRAMAEPPAWPKVKPWVSSARATCARLIGAHEDEIAFVKNTSEGISTAAFGLPWQRGDRVVVCSAEYPSNLWPWLRLREQHGVEVVVVPESIAADGVRRVSVERLLEAIDQPCTRALALSHVEYASGQRFDLAQLGAYCRARGIVFIVDAIQSLGAFPVDVNDMAIDVLATDGHKWLLSSAGTGFLYVRRELQARIRPLSVGWLNVRERDYSAGQPLEYVEGGQQYEAGSLNVAGVLALEASIRLLLEAGLSEISERLLLLTSRLVSQLEHAGYTVVSPRAATSWSGIVSFSCAAHASREIAQALKQHDIHVAVRNGWVRVSPHFYNTEQQIDSCVAALPRV
jgi:selenocysteine lyase/cysteine desulfurase